MDGWTEQWRVFVKPDLKSKRGDWRWILGIAGRLSAFSNFCRIQKGTTDTLTHIQEHNYIKWPSSPRSFWLSDLSKQHRHTQMGCISCDAKRRDLMKWKRSGRRLSPRSVKSRPGCTVFCSAGDPQVLTFTSLTQTSFLGKVHCQEQVSAAHPDTWTHKANDCLTDWQIYWPHTPQLFGSKSYK